MTALDLLRGALKQTDKLADRLIGDIRDKPLMRTSPGDGNHALWIVGHLALVEGMLTETITGEPNPLADWEPLFGMGSKPGDDVDAYPPFDEVHRAWRDLRAKTYARLETIGEADLDRPSPKVRPGFEDFLSPVGKALHLLSLHQMFHLGQVADIRRADGRAPFM